MVHGSPKPESNDDVFAVVEKVRAAQKYFYVQVGFLECNEPSISEAIQNCVAAGARRVVAVPYFLHAGRHVADDLPRLLEDASAQYPQVEFLMGEYLGQEPMLAKVLLELAAV
jgi:sirohydrochlorin cobaltochelatase